MFENFVIGLKYSIMFFYRDYNNYIIDLHIYEKTIFYSYKYFYFFKNIILLIKYIKINYNIIPLILNTNIVLKNKLLFNSYFNNDLFFSHVNNSYNVYNIYIKDMFFYKYNVLYNFIISFFRNEFESKLLMELTHKNREFNFFLSDLKVNITKLTNSNTHFIYDDIKNVNSLCSIVFKTNTSNFYFNKLFLSHTFFNI